MAEDTSIFQEIDEALRADKAQELWKRHSGEILTFCVMVVIATAASVLWKNHVREVHEETTGTLTQAVTLAQDGKYPEAISLYEKVEAKGGGLGGLAALRHAQALIALKQEDKALTLYKDVSAGRKADAPETLRDYAALQADILAHNEALASGKPVTDGSKPAAGSDNSFSRSFAELDALRTLQAGDAKAAAAKLEKIANDPAAPFSLRMRDALFSGPKEEPAK
jgi:hypothetical protein